MKPPPFRYHAPESLDEALEALAEVGDDGKVLAGGQSLIPLLNMRLAAPSHLVDINRLPGLGTIEVADDGVRIGATVRHAHLEADDAAYAANPLLRQALRLVAHPVIRNRGTVVGSLAHADPAGETPAVLALCGGSVEVASRDGRRTIAADELFLGPLESSVRPDEVVTHATFPGFGPATGTAFEELSRRHGDYAMAGVGVVVGVDEDHRLDRAQAAFIGVGSVPSIVDLTPACAGQTADALDLTDAVAHARGAIEPTDDIHATAAYRRHLAGVLLARALMAAAGRATTDGTSTADDGERA